MPEIESVTGMSLESFEDAVSKALEEIPPGPEALRRASVVRWWVESGGIVGRIQYHVELQPSHI